MPTALVPFLAVLGPALLSMAWFALRGSRPDADAQGKGAQFALGAGNFLVHWFMWVLRPVDWLAARAGLSPDFFNFAGLACGVASGVLIGLGRLELGGWAIVVGGVCDIMDGRVARATQVDSKYGKFIDSTLDRFVEVFALLGFVVFLRATPYGSFCAAAALSGSLLVSYARARGESLGVLCREGLMQRAERLVLTILVCWLDRALAGWWGLAAGTPSTWVLGAIAVGTFGTATQRTIWISRRLRERA
jgi:CDP-diacylglycerol--glycerol-3-phosphate 3-phosphatidyltransferase